MKDMHDIIVRPILTEKGYEGIADKCYVFEVPVNATKTQIKQAVEQMYNVTVVAVNTMKYDGKIKARMTKAGYIVGKKPSYKKAIVTLKDGDKIDFYSNI